MIVETCPHCGEPIINISLDTYPPIPKKRVLEMWMELDRRARKNRV